MAVVARVVRAGPSWPATAARRDEAGADRGRVLRASGIARVRRPQAVGDCPPVLYWEGAAAAAAVEFVHVDLSRADASAGDQRPRRGRGGRRGASPRAAGAAARSCAAAADGRSVDYAVPADALIGRMTTDGYLAAARAAAGARDATTRSPVRTRDRDEERRYAAGATPWSPGEVKRA